MVSDTTPEVPVRATVPVRTILATIGLILATVVAVLFVMRVEQVLVWMVIALFFTVALYPLVDWVQRRMSRCRRSLATLLVFLVVLLVLGGLLTAFAVPLASEGTQLAGQLPGIVTDARAGRGPVGDLLERTNALQFVQNNEDAHPRVRHRPGHPRAQPAARRSAPASSPPSPSSCWPTWRSSRAPRSSSGTLALFPPQRAERIRRVTRDCAKTVTGYISGNLLISAICGVLTYAVLKFSGVPFAGLIALFVAIADLIPLVGATLGAVVACIAAFLHSVPAGIAVVIFFVLYQQLENHLLQPLIFARTVKLNPLAVLVAILLAVELAGILGALLAIPVAGIIQVILRDLWDRRGAPKGEPTVGEDRVPVDAAANPDDEARLQADSPSPNGTTASREEPQASAGTGGAATRGPASGAC